VRYWQQVNDPMKDFPTVTYLVDKHVVQRANTVLLLTMLWGGFAACALGAVIYDLTYWLSH
jgi:hypothetical protein